MADGSRECSVRWCSRAAARTVGKTTGYMFYLCDKHANATSATLMPGLAIGVPYTRDDDPAYMGVPPHG